MMGPRRASSDRPPTLAANAYRRMWAIIGVYAAIGVLLAWAADLPLGLRADNIGAQAAMTVAFVAVNAAMTVYRVDRNNSLRRTNETLTEMWYVVGLFWLAPWALIVGRVAAAFAAWQFTKMRWQFRFYNAVMYAIVSIVLVRTYLVISPDGAHDGWRAVVVAVAVWLLNDIIRIGAHVILDGFRHDRFRLDLVWPSLSTSYLRLIACAFGLLIAAALEVSPWILLAVAAVGVLFVAVSKANSRAASIGAGIEQIARLRAGTVGAQHPSEVEAELLVSVEAFGRLATAAIASGRIDAAVAADATPSSIDRASCDRTPGDRTAGDDAVGDEAVGDEAVGDEAPFGDGPSPGRVEWDGRLRPGLDATVSSPTALVDLAAGPPVVTADRKGTVAAWSLDPMRASFLVVESTELTADQSDLWTTVGHLVDYARLAIDAVYKAQRLSDLAALEHQRARVDALTELPNRFAALGELSNRLARPDRAPLSVVLLESLGYQEFVNVLGLDFADATIMAFADHLRHLMDRGELDYVAHVTAAQFVVFVPGDATQARAVAELACHHHPRSGDAQHRGDTSAQRVAAGIAAADASTSSAEELLRAASLALHSSNDDEPIASFGRTDAASAQRRMSIRHQLNAAIAARDIFPEFQPQISLATGAVSGCEVLARWKHRDLGNVGPAEFIPISEQSGHVERLTLAITEQALDRARHWNGDDPLDVSINISARSLDRPAFVRSLVRIVDEAGWPTTATTIEITESTLVERASMTLALDRIHELGFRISIDDFGTGYSALSYLDRLPADEVKIDQSMVRPIAPGAPVSPVVHHLIDLCQTLGLSVCAEGIENQYQLDVLRTLGCDIGQGFHYSRSLTADAMDSWLDGNRSATTHDFRVGGTH